ncbi:hypothetical protein V1478_005868 [Vespula squamosa]|uniref:Uncharacterized protein n=1 Tax=Vespula squamosa TaxID=30214 RepID=A0ABD2BA13_VESSQ
MSFTAAFLLHCGHLRFEDVQEICNHLKRQLRPNKCPQRKQHKRCSPVHFQQAKGVFQSFSKLRLKDIENYSPLFDTNTESSPKRKLNDKQYLLY